MKKKILITGVEGFAGKHLVRHLRKERKEDALYGSFFMEPDISASEGCEFFRMDIMSRDNIRQALRERGPFDEVYHLAGVSSVRFSWDSPEETLKVNAAGTFSLLDALRASESKPRFLYVSSCEVYAPGQDVLDETSLMRPQNPYAVSKACAEQFVQMFGDVFGVPVFIVRPVPHAGPGQSEGFAIMNFCRQVSELKKQKAPSPFISVGNIEVRRDYLDVRDVVSAYSLVCRAGKSGEVYNVSSGAVRSMQEILSLIQKESGVSFDIRRDPSRMRASDPDVPLISSARIKELGWAPRFKMEDTIRDILKSLQSPTSL